MGESKHPHRLATAMAIILGTAGAGASEAEAQSRLNVYSSDFGGPNQPAPSGAARDTVISMGVPRLHAIMRDLRAIEQDLNTHDIPPHGHPHSHPPPPPIDQDSGDQDTDGDQDSGDQDSSGDGSGACGDGDSPSPPGCIDGFDPGMSDPASCAGPGW